MNGLEERRVTAETGTILDEALLQLEGGWQALPRLNLDTGGAALAVDYVLLHPRHGVVLLEAEPGRGGDPTTAFRQMLEDQEFAGVFPGTFPVLHLVLQPADAAGFARRLREAFACVPRLTMDNPDWAEALSDLLLALQAARGDRPSAFALRRADPAPEGESEPDFTAPAWAPATPAPVPALAAEQPLARRGDVSWDDLRVPMLPLPPRRPRRDRRRVAFAVLGAGLFAGGALLVGAQDEPAPALPPVVIAALPPIARTPAPQEGAPAPHEDQTSDTAGSAGMADVGAKPPPSVAEPERPSPEDTAGAAPANGGEGAAAPPAQPDTPAPPPASPPAQLSAAPSQPSETAAPAPSPRPAAPPSVAPRPPVTVAKPPPKPAPHHPVAPSERRFAEAPARPTLPPPPPPIEPPPAPVASAPSPPPAPERAVAMSEAARLSLRGLVAPPAARAETRNCRVFSAANTMLGLGRPVSGIACQTRDGSWEIVSEATPR